MATVRRRRDLVVAFDDDAAFDRAFAAAYAVAAARHKHAGVPLVIWRDGRITLVPPAEIVVPQDRIPGTGRHRSHSVVARARKNR
jgi:hypothetical protein